VTFRFQDGYIGKQTMIDMRKLFTLMLGGMLLGTVAVSCAGGSTAGDSEEQMSANDDYGYAGDEDYVDMEYNSPAQYGGEADKIDVSYSADTSAVAYEQPHVSQEVVMDRMLIKTATLSFEVQDLSATTTKVEGAIDQFEAYVGSMNQSDSYGRRTVSYQIKVPNENFEPLVRLICSGVNKFETKQIDVADVTEEFIDVKARIKTKKDLEDQYSALLDKAETIGEILEIESHLSAVRTEIESAEGRLKYLKSSVKYSTIYLDYYEEVPELALDESEYSAAFTNSFEDGWHFFVMLFVGLTSLWPFLLIGSILLTYFILRRKRRKRGLAA